MVLKHQLGNILTIQDDLLDKSMHPPYRPLHPSEIKPTNNPIRLTTYLERL